MHGICRAPHVQGHGAGGAASSRDRFRLTRGHDLDGLLPLRLALARPGHGVRGGWLAALRATLVAALEVVTAVRAAPDDVALAANEEFADGEAKGYERQKRNPQPRDN